MVTLSRPQIKAEDDQPLPGVLLSLSGGVFRSNLLTQDNGVLTFSNLVSCPVPERLPVFPTMAQGHGVRDGVRAAHRRGASDVAQGTECNYSLALPRT